MRKFVVLTVSFVLFMSIMPFALAMDTFDIIYLSKSDVAGQPDQDLYAVEWDQSTADNGSKGDYALMGGDDCAFYIWEPVGNNTIDMEPMLDDVAGQNEDVFDIIYNGTQDGDITYVFATYEDGAGGTSGIFNKSSWSFVANPDDNGNIGWKDVEIDGAGDMVLIGYDFTAGSEEGAIYYWNGYTSADNSFVNLSQNNLLIKTATNDNYPQCVVYNEWDGIWYIFVWNTTLERTDVYRWNGGLGSKIVSENAFNYTKIESADYDPETKQIVVVGMNSTAGKQKGQTLIYDYNGNQFIDIISDDADYDGSGDWLYDINFHPGVSFPSISSGEALIVGIENDTAGYQDYGIYKYCVDTDTNTFQDALLDGKTALYASAWEPRYGDYALVVGEGGVMLHYYLSAVADEVHEIKGEITGVAPEIDNVTLKNSSGTSMLLKQLDIDTQYTLEFTVKDENGWEDIAEDGFVAVHFWFDWGDDTVKGYNYTSAGETRNNYRYHFNYTDNHTDNTYASSYEFQEEEGNFIHLSNSTVNHTKGDSDIWYEMKFTLTFKLNGWCKQADDPIDTGSKFQNLWSWNFEIKASDGYNVVNANNTEDCSEIPGSVPFEFGVYKYLKLTLGGDDWVFGEGAPGDYVSTDNGVGAKNPTLTFYSNDDCTLKFWFKEEFKDEGGTHSIPVSNINLSGWADHNGAGFPGIGMGNAVEFLATWGNGDHGDTFADNTTEEDFWMNAVTFDMQIPVPTYAGSYSATIVVALVQIYGEDPI